MDRTELLRRAFAFSMAEEGGATYTDDARDPGGPTKWGVALNYNREAIPDKDGNGVITAEDVRRLTAADALAIYTERYWRPHIRAEYPDALAFMLADMVFNPGPGAAPRLLQQACTACGRRIDADGYVLKYEMNLTEVMQKIMDKAMEAADSTDASSAVKVEKTSISMVCSQFNAVKEITIPEEAKSAESISANQ